MKAMITSEGHVREIQYMIYSMLTCLWGAHRRGPSHITVPGNRPKNVRPQMPPLTEDSVSIHGDSLEGTKSKVKMDVHRERFNAKTHTGLEAVPFRTSFILGYPDSCHDKSLRYFDSTDPTVAS